MSPYGFDQGVLTGVAIRKRNNARVNQFEFLEVFSARGEGTVSMLYRFRRSGTMAGL